MGCHFVPVRVKKLYKDGIAVRLGVKKFDMAKITYQDALPRRSLYADTDAKPSVSMRAPVLASVKASGIASLEAAGVHVPFLVAAPAVPAPYAEWLARIGLTAVDAATLLGVTRQSAHAWSKPDGEAPLHVRQRLALIERIGLDAARTVLSGLDA